MARGSTKTKYHENFIDGLTLILVEQGAINMDEACNIAKAFHDSSAYEFDAFLLEEGLVSVAHLLKALERYYKVPSFDVMGHFFEHALLQKFPKHFLIRHGIIPLEDDESTLVLVASDPANSDLLIDIGKYVSYDVQLRVGIYQDIIDAIKEFYDGSLTEGVAQDLYDLPDTRMADPSEFDELEDMDIFYVDQDQEKDGE